MDYKLIQETAFIKKAVYEGNVEQSVDIDITLPDYCPDILRILKCHVYPQVTGYQASGDRLLIDGTVLVRVLYVDESEKRICAHECVSPFSKSIEISGQTDNLTVDIKTHVEYVNCRAVNPRRIDLHGAFTLGIKAQERQKECFITGADGDELQILLKSMDISDIVGNIRRQFVLNEVFNLGDSKPPVKQIIRTESHAAVSEYKVITNKILIKGEVRIRILYMSDEDGSKLEMLENSIPVSQIIDMDGIDDECECQVKLETLTIETCAKPDSMGDMRLIECNVRLCAIVNAVKNISIPVVIDAYSLRYEVSAEYRQMSGEKYIASLDEKFIEKSRLDLSAGVSEICDVWCGEVSFKTSFCDGEPLIEGKACVCVLYRDENGIVNYAEREVEFKHEIQVKEKCDQAKLEVTLEVISIDFTISGRDGVDVRIEIEIAGAVVSVCNERIIMGVDVKEESEKKNESPALVIYFAANGESVWEIAKRYNTTVKAICDENDLRSGIVDRDGMILIPVI